MTLSDKIMLQAHKEEIKYAFIDMEDVREFIQELKDKIKPALIWHDIETPIFEEIDKLAGHALVHSPFNSSTRWDKLDDPIKTKRRGSPSSSGTHSQQDINLKQRVTGPADNSDKKCKSCKLLQSMDTTGHAIVKCNHIKVDFPNPKQFIWKKGSDKEDRE